MTEKIFADLTVGEECKFEVVVDRALVQSFAAFSGDNNPLHVDEAYATDTVFGSIVPHGMIAGAFFSRLIGVHLPGKYSLYLSQTLLFRNPIVMNQTLVVIGRILQKVESSRVVTMRTQLTVKNTDIVLVEGQAMVKLLR